MDNTRRKLHIAKSNGIYDRENVIDSVEVSRAIKMLKNYRRGNTLHSIAMPLMKSMICSEWFCLFCSIGSKDFCNGCLHASRSERRNVWYQIWNDDTAGSKVCKPNDIGSVMEGRQESWQPKLNGYASKRDGKSPQSHICGDIPIEINCHNLSNELSDYEGRPFDNRVELARLESLNMSTVYVLVHTHHGK